MEAKHYHAIIAYMGLGALSLCINLHKAGRGIPVFNGFNCNDMAPDPGMVAAETFLFWPIAMVAPYTSLSSRYCA